NAAERGEQIRDAILGMRSPLVAGVRGRGLLIGVALTAPAAGDVVTAAQERGLIVNAANLETVRIAPALNIGDTEIDEFRVLFADALNAVATGSHAARHAPASTGKATKVDALSDRREPK